MGHRIGSLVLVFATMISAQDTLSLGLGNIDLKSSLNQPLDAEIALLEVRELTETEILTRLGSPEDFERLGVDRIYFLTDIDFDVRLNAPGGPVVHVTSSRPVREPFLNFIVEARWPSGKLLREYTMLLDLPLFSDEASAPVSTVQTETLSSNRSAPSDSSSAPTSGNNTVFNPRSSYGSGSNSGSSTTRSSSTQSRASYDGDSYRVQNNDTLWEIALSVRPGGDVSVHQTMLALQAHNPEAFINGNINLLKAGQVLRIPTRDDIANVNGRQAVREVAVQNREWAGDTAAPLEASSSSLSSYAEDTVGEGRLSLTAPDDSFDATQGRISGGTENSSTSSKALEQELSVTQETLDKTQGENSELRGKITSLEDQIRTLESMIELSNDSLAELQAQASQTNELESAEGTVSEDSAMTLDALVDDAASESEAFAASDAETELADSEQFDSDVVESSETLASSGLSEESAQADATAPAKKSDPSKVVYSAPKKSPGFVDLLMEYIAFIGIFVIVLIGIVLAFIKQRNKDSEDDYDDFLMESDDSEETDLPVYDEEAESSEDDFDEEDLGEDLGDFEDEELDESPEAETEDVVAESDIYIAYGKYDQAEEMLLKALNREPGHHEARLKLLEVYAAQDNVEAFDPNYATLRASTAPDGILTRATGLRDSMAGVPEFNESLYSTGEFDIAEVESDAEDDLGDDDLALDVEDVDDMSFDLNLDDVEAGGDLEAGYSSDAPDDFDTTETELNVPVAADLDESDELIELDIDSSDDSIELDLDGLDLELPDTKLEDGIELDDGDLGDGVDFDLDLGSLELEGGLELDDDVDLEEGLASEDEFDLDLGLDDSNDGSSNTSDLADLEAELELVLEDDGATGESQSAEDDTAGLDDSFDFDIGVLDESSDSALELDGGELSVQADDSSLDELEFDLSSLDDVGGSADDSVEEVAVGSGESDEDLSDISLVGDLENDLNAIDLDVGLDDDETLSFDAPVIDASGDPQAEDSTIADEVDSSRMDDIDISLDDIEIDEEFDLEKIVGNSGADQVVSDLDVVDLDSDDIVIPELDNGDVDVSSSEGEDDTIIREMPELDLSPDDESEDDLSITGMNFDIAALDQELEALTSDLSNSDVETAGIELDLDSDGDDTAQESSSADALPDFDDFDIDAELNVDASSTGIESDEVNASDLGASDVVLEEPDLDFGDAGFDLDSPAEGEVNVVLEEPDLSFAEPAVEEPISAPPSDVTTDQLSEAERLADSGEFSDDELDFELPEIDPESTDDDDLDFLSSSDETATKLDLAAAYIDMGDTAGAKEIIDEILREGSDVQKTDAQELLNRMSD